MFKKTASATLAVFLFLTVFSIANDVLAVGDNPSSPELGLTRNPRLYDVDGTTGAFTYEYSIVSPPGRNKLQPDIKLVYNSYTASNLVSVIGKGWNINIPVIERTNKYGSQTLFSETTFISPFDGELVYSTSTIYLAKSESGAFRKYIFSNNAWTVTDKDGLIYKFGHSSSTRKYNVATTSSQIYAWYLEEVRDQNNNYIKYEYSKDGSEIYPDTVTYTGNDVTDGIFKISFTKSMRPDVATSSVSGFPVATRYRITDITTKINNVPARRFVLSYGSADNASSSVLTSITQSAFDSGSTTTLPTETFEYSVPTPSWTHNASWTVPKPFNSIYTQLADANGDGYIDILHTEGGVNYVYINNGSTGWNLDTAWSVPESVSATEKVVFADANGDGFTDLIRSHSTVGGPVKRVYINSGTAWNLDSSWTIPEFFNDYTYLVDINGDYLVDILSTDGGNNKVYINNGKGWTLNTGWIIPYSFGPDEGVRLADINGDGLIDFLKSKSGIGGPEQYVYINTGRNWSFDSTWSIPEFFGPKTILADINGDTLPEILISDSGNEKVYINNGSGWTYRNTWDIPILFGSSEGVQIFDANGDGMGDIVKSYNGTIDDVYINNGTNADYLSSVTNPKGGRIEIEYKNTTEYRNTNNNLLNPKLPYSIETVSRVTENSGYGKIEETEYEYSGGLIYYGGSFDKKFATFASTTRTTDLAKTTTYYHQGNDNSTSTSETNDHPSKIGLTYRAETRDLNSNLYSLTRNNWSTSTVTASSTFVKLDSLVTLNYDGDSDHRDSATSYTYNVTNGNPISQTEWGEVTGSSDGTFTDTGSDKRTTSYGYATNTGAYIIGLPSSERLDDQSGNKIKESRYYYDNQSLGSVTKGNLTKKEDWATSSSYVNTQSSYNSYGLKTQDLDPRGNATNYVYDTYNLYPATTTNALSQSIKYTYDYSSGKPLTVTDPNGFIHEQIYDGLDRLTEVKEPRSSDGTRVTTEMNTYTDTRGAVKVQNTKYLSATNTVDTYAYADGFGRMVQDRSETETANQFAVRDHIYGTDGMLVKDSLPYFSTGSASTSATTQNKFYTTYAYDPLGRKIGIGTILGTTTIGYDQLTETVTDTLSHAKTYGYDAYGQLTSVIERNGTSTYTTTYGWTPHGLLAKVTDALGNVRNFAYNGLGQRTRLEDLHASGDGTYGAWTYAYDEAGNVSTTTDPKGQVVVMTYDSLNRPTAENYTGQAGTEITYAYDSCTNGKGYLCTAKNASATTTRTYSPAGLVASESKTIGTTTYTQSSTYDRQNNLTGITYPDNSDVRYTYNTAGQLEKIEERENGGAYRDIITNFDYGPTGQVTYQLHGNGASTTRLYDDNELYRLRSIVTSATLPQGGGGADLALLEAELFGASTSSPLTEVLGEATTTDLLIQGDGASTTGEVLDLTTASDTPLLDLAPATDTQSGTGEQTIGTSTAPEDTVLEETVSAGETTIRSIGDHPLIDSLDYFIVKEAGSESADVYLSKTEPKAHLMKWNGEIDLGVAYQNVQSVGTLDPLREKIEWKNSTEEVHAYPIDGRADIGGSGFEIEVVLNEKPTTNTFDFSIDGAEALDFFYQPSLAVENENDPTVKCTETQCIDEKGTVVSERPENVVGSYAVYHRDRRGHEEGGFDYGTGKVFHIYRPKIVDAGGREVWGALQYEKGMLTVTVPQEFLDTATYPVTVDPTFGYSTIGASSADTANFVGSKFTMNAESGVLTKISVYTKKSAAGTMNKIAALYSDVSGAPNTLLATQATATAGVGTTASWVDILMNSYTLTSSGTYWLWHGHNTSATVYWDTGSTNQYNVQGITYPSWPSTITPGTYYARKISAYATYTRAPSAPSALLAEGQTNPTNITDATPEFSAIYQDVDSGDVAKYYRIQVATTSAFTATVWDTNQTLLASTTSAGSRIADISYSGSSLASSTTYYWRIMFWDIGGATGSWSTTTSTFSLAGGGTTTTSYMIYDDALHSNWSTSTVSATTTLSTTTVYSGTNAIKVSFNSTSYSDINFRYNGTFDQNVYSTLDFDVNGGSQSGQGIWLYFVDPNNNDHGCCFAGDYISGGITAGTWKHVSIPLADFGTTTVPLKSLIFTTNELTTIYLDNIQFVGSTTSSTSSTPTSPIFVPVVQSITYTYDSVGNITQIVDRSGTNAAATTTYTYDDLYRLTSASTTNASTTPYRETYTYDALGNLTSKSDQGTYTYAGTNYANPHAVTSLGGTTYNYDRNGNLASTTASVTNSWDYRNRLTQAVKGTATTTYGYDVDTTRLTKTVGGITTRYPSQFYEVTGASTTKHVYIPGGGIVASVEGGGRVYHNHLDHLESTSAVTDDVGYLSQLLAYKPFGSTRISTQYGSFSESNQFVGQERDAEADLNYLNARYYDGQRGQFISQDPVFLDMGLETLETFAVMRNPQLQNSYSYAGNNPIKDKDPNGRIIDTLVDFGFIAYDVYRVGDAYFNGGNVQEELGYLALDAAGAATPFATGFGAIARTAKVAGKAEKAYEEGRIVETGIKVGEAGGPGAGKPFPKSVKDSAYNQANGKCVFCGVNTPKNIPGPTQANADHAISRKNGGNNTINNAQNSCRSCNQSKGSNNSVQFVQKQLIKVLKAYVKKLGG